MNNLKTYLVFLCIGLQLYAVQLCCQSEVLWSQVLGGSSNDVITGIISDGIDGAIILGHSSSENAQFGSLDGKNDVFLHGINEDGSISWSDNLGDAYNEQSGQIVSNANSYVLSTNNYSPSEEASAINLISFDQDNQQLYSTSIGLEGVQIPKVVLTSKNGDVFLCGMSSCSNGRFGGMDIFVSKLNSKGGILWTKYFGGSSYDSVESMVELPNGSFILSGFTYSKDGFVDVNYGQKDSWLMHMDANGEVVWSKNVGKNGFDKLAAAAIDKNGEVILCGSRGNFEYSDPIFKGIHNDDLWLIKINSAGSVLWEKEYGGTGNEAAKSILATSNGDFLVLATTDSNDDLGQGNKGKKDALVLSINSSGDIQWSSLYGGEGYDELSTAFEDNKGHYWLAGFSDSKFSDVFASYGQKDSWLIKIEGELKEFAADLGEDISICIGETALLDASILNCDCTYSWSSGSMDSNIEVNPNVDMSYTVTITNALGETSADQINVRVNSAPAANLFTVDPTCKDLFDGQINLQLTAGEHPFAFTWSNSDDRQSINGLLAGDYQVTITDANGCSAAYTARLNEPEPIVISYDISQISCSNGESGSISTSSSGGTGPYSYLWNTSAVTKDVENLSAGVYSLTVSDIYNCTKDEEFIITDPDGLNVETEIYHATCFDGADGQIQIDISGGVGEYIIEWDNGSKETSLSNLSAGVYVLTVTDENDCQSIQQYEIFEGEEILINSIIKDETCLGDRDGQVSVSLEGGEGDLDLIWSTQEESLVISNLEIGTYSLTVTDALGCEAFQNYQIREGYEIFIEAAIQEVLCHDSPSGQISLEVSGQTGDLSINWNANVGGLVESDLLPGQYSVVVQDENNCQAEEVFELENPSDIESTSSIGHINCFGQNTGNILVDASGGTGQLQYLWQDGTTENQINNLTAGFYQLSIEDANGCQDVLDFELGEPVPIGFEISATEPNCIGNNGSIAVTVEGGVDPYQIEWSDINNSLLSTADIAEDLGPGLYFLMITDANGCTDETEILLLEDELAENTFILNSVDCPGLETGSIIVSNAIEDMEFLWSDGSSLSSLENLSGGTYYLTITQMGTCQTVHQFQIEEPEGFSLVHAVGDETCFEAADGEIAIAFNGGTIPYEYIWSNGEDTTFLENLLPGQYSVEIYDANNCPFDTSFVVLEAEEIIVTPLISQPTNNNANGTIDLEITGGTAPMNVVWSNGLQGTSINSLTAGEFAYTVLDVYGCEKTGIVVLTFVSSANFNGLNSALSLYPNPANDKLFIELEKNIAEYAVEIYSIEGRKIDVDIVKKDSEQIALNISRLTSGIYIVKLITGSEIYQSKISVQKY